MKALPQRSAGRLRVVAPLLDAACLCIFVLLGRESHGVDAGASWFLVVVWPFLAGWYASALALRLYTSPARLPLRWSATVALGVAIALLVRVTVTHRTAPIAFIVVAYAFVALLTGGWRLAGGLPARRSTGG